MPKYILATCHMEVPTATIKGKEPLTVIAKIPTLEDAGILAQVDHYYVSAT